MSVDYQSTALVVGPPGRIAELATISRNVKGRDILFVEGSQLVMTEIGNYGESLTSEVLEWAERDHNLEVLVSWANEGGVGATYGMREGILVFEEHEDDIFTPKEKDSEPLSANAVWARLMGNYLCRLVPSEVKLSDYLPGYLRPIEKDK